MSDLEKAFTTLTKKNGGITRRNNYYNGDQPLVYSSNRLAEIFGNSLASFKLNWCSVVVDSTLDRIDLKGFDVVKATAEANNKLDGIWNQYHLELDAEEVHKDALVTSESYVIAWKREDGTIDVYHNKSSMCHIFYDPDYPKEKKFAAKWFFGTDDKWHITLYYRDRLEYYRSSSKEMPSAASGFSRVKLDKPATNPFGEIPVFHFKCPSELDDLMTVQDAINKTFVDMMVAGEFGSFKQRFIISDSDTTQLKNVPGGVWSIPKSEDGKDQVGEFSGEDLTKFWNAVEGMANYVSIKSRIPKFYLTEVGAGISGDALIAMEAPLVHKAEKRIRQFSATWQEVGAFILKLSDMPVNQANVVTLWGRVKSEQPLAETQAINFGVSSGLALKTMLRRQGWNKVEIQQAMDDLEEQKKMDASLSKTLLDVVRKRQADANVTGLEDLTDA
ncbi:MAG: hypothetical protein CVU43_04535 [Chloroflexi bacterium HGW-Chloroflexi-5]|jgi:hypothetical protein|nr:MAG: hypothetical protein CVU43_04535 [Chloroflexi bacterium HGW-Chloroflexi-5]